MADKEESTVGDVIIEPPELEKLLADEYVLYMRTRDAIRKIADRSPAEVHQLLENQCRSISAIVADVGRAVRSLGVTPSFNHEDFLGITRLNRHVKQFQKQNEIIAALLEDHESIIGRLRNDEAHLMDRPTDINSAEFTPGLLKQHEELAGALKGWLE